MKEIRPAFEPTAKEWLLSSIAGLFLFSHVLFQIPVNPVERLLARLFEPIQFVTYTNRAYYMYAPNPVSVKNVPMLRIAYASGFQEVYGLENMNYLNLPLGILSTEKWSNINTRMVKDMLGEWEGQRTALSGKIFNAVAGKVCQEKQRLKPVSVTLTAKTVFFGRFGIPPQWKDERELQSFKCS